ncbi:hypothetical protein [Streptomyces sp. NPDC000851]
MAAVKVIFVLAVFRVLATPFTKDFLGDELLPMPTWEWSLCALTPVILICLVRRRDDWARVAGERTFLKIALTFYLLYALAFVVFQGEWILWIAVAASLGGFAGLHHVNRGESADAH